MSFLDNTGLAYFYNKLKEKFIRSVNGETPDATGNVRINEVDLAKNLTAPDAQASIDTFVYRTTGGSASLNSGEANLVLINGNTTITGRVEENVTINATNNLAASVADLALLRTAVNNTTGEYVLGYTRPTSSESTTGWTPEVGTWSYNSETTSLTSWGVAVNNLVAPSISLALSGTGITVAAIVPNTFTNIINYISNTYTFSYINEYDPESAEPVIIDSYWTLNGVEVTLSDYGITTTGTAVAGDAITVTYVAGTPNSTLTINYTAPLRGQINVTNPTKFVSTGFNQFDKNSTDPNQSGVIENATISNDSIISNSGTYVCYCKAVGGDHGYIAESLGEHIVVSGGMGWCASVPQIGSTVVTTSVASDDSVTSTSADFTYMQDGYVLVVVDNTSDLMMWCEWSGDVNGQQTYTAYVAPSEIDIPTVGYIDGVSYNLPTASYGMPRLGTVYDTVNFEAQTYIKRIERLAYSAGNLALVQDMDPVPVYDYDNTNIFYVLPSPITYTFIGDDGIYQADDHGTEEFIGTNVPVVAEMLYGQNLRDKLRTDVLTISEQNPPLNDHQKLQVLSNIGLSNVSNPNLLDNWYFVGGGSQLGYGYFPLNSNGQTSYVGGTNTIDRWYGYQSQVTINVTTSGLSIHRSSGDFYSLVQKVSNVTSLRGKQVTATLLATGFNRIRLLADDVSIGDSGDSSSANSINSVTVTIPNDAEELLFILYTTSTVDTLAIAAKLELGSTQTLAHQENSAWVLNEIPNYEIESTKVSGTLYFKDVPCSATTGDFASINNSAITSSHVVTSCIFADSSAITTDVTWTTADSQLTLNGTCTAATTANIILVKKNN